LNVRVGNAHDGVKTSVASKSGHEVHGYGIGLSLEHILDLLGLEIATDEGIFEEGCEFLGRFGGVFDGEEFALNLFEGVGFGGSGEGSVGVASVEAVEVNGGTVGRIRGHGTPDGGSGCRAEEGDVG